MLSSPRPEPRRARRQSLRQEYEEFVLQRIEQYKEELSRPALLAIADEAVRELEVGSEEQLVLTEVLVLEHVDRLITRRLKLPSFRRWRERYLKLRQEQLDPIHWGLEPDLPLAELALQVEEEDGALIVGGRAAAAGLFLASHDWRVLFIDQDLSTIEAAEKRAAAEGLAAQFQALVLSLGTCLPDVTPTLTVLDPVALSLLDAATRERVLDTFKTRTRSGGIHCILPAKSEGGATPLAADALKAHYSDWALHHTSRGSRWFVTIKP